MFNHSVNFKIVDFDPGNEVKNLITSVAESSVVMQLGEWQEYSSILTGSMGCLDCVWRLLSRGCI